MTLRTQYTVGLTKLGFVKQQTRSTKFDVYLGTTALLYGIDPKESNEVRYVFVSTRGSSLRIGRSPKTTDYTMPAHPKTKTRLIAFANQ